MSRNSLHDEIDATYSVFEKDGRILLQIDTFGRSTREIPGKKSQTLQLDKRGAENLYRILQKEFHFD
ncbi:MAG: methionyl-tRNA formyltransferase [Rhizobiales bacterium]|nr:methionyl-tRNA formyltransferase [Hyphomicrobiales bacterium]